MPPPGVNICTQENICDDDPHIKSWEADPDSDKTLYNWQQQLDLTCKSDVEVGVIGASYLIGYTAAILWMPGFADKYGRKKFFLLAMFIDLALYTAMFFTRSYAFMVFI